MRWFAAAFLVLFSFAATAQAAHIHGQWLPQNKAQVHAPVEATQSNGGEDRCPLCTALHSAMPVSLQTAPPPPALYVIKLAEASCHVPAAPWPFANFSRPPPSLA